MAETVAAPRQPGILAKASGFFSSLSTRLDGAVGFSGAKPKTKAEEHIAYSQLQNLSPSMAAVLRPQAAFRWILPYIASITPQYVESILRGALAGNHVQAWELFDLMLDSNPEMASCVSEYVEGILAHKIIFEPYHEEDEEPTDTALEKCKLVSSALRGMRPDPASDENALRGTIFDLMFARFHGQSVLEIDWHDTYGTGDLNYKNLTDGRALCPRSTFWVHPVCYAWNNNGRLGLRLATLANGSFKDQSQGYRTPQQQLIQQQMDRNRSSMFEPPAWNMLSSQPQAAYIQDFPKHKFLVSTMKCKAGTALGGSCLRSLAALWVMENFSQDFIMNQSQLFQVPFRMATFTPNTPPAVQEEIRHMLQSMGHTAWGLFPQGVDIKFESAASNTGASPAAWLMHYCDTAIRKVILHQTMTGGGHDSMGKGGGKAFGEVEQDTKDACIENGCRFAEEQINLQLVPSILELNYGEDGDSEAPQCKLVDSAVGGLADAQRDQVLAQIMQIPAPYLHAKYGIPKPSADDDVAGVDSGIQGAQAQQEQANVEADRNQAAKVAKQQADALARQPKAQNGAPGANGHANGNGKNGAPAPGQQPKQPGQQERQPAGSDDNDAMDGRNSALTAEEAGHPFHGNQFTSSSSTSAKDTADVIQRHMESQIPTFEPKGLHPHWHESMSEEEKVATLKELHKRGLVSDVMGRKKKPPTAGELMNDIHNHRKYGIGMDGRGSDGKRFDLEALEAASAGDGGKGCLMAMLPEDDTHRFTDWAKTHVEEGTLAADGIEKEPHVTVYYGFNLGFDVQDLSDLLKRRKPVTFTVGKVSRFECPEYDVLKYDIVSPDLEDLHSVIQKRLSDLTPSEHEYHPHLTIAYVEKGSNKELDGLAPFEGDQFTCSSLLFSEPEHTNRATIALQAKQASVQFDTNGKDAAAALHETVQPMLDRIAAIEKVADPATRKAMLRKLLKDQPHVAAAMLHDDSLARAIAPAVIKKFVRSFAKPKGAK